MYQNLFGQVLRLLLCRYSNEGSTDPLFSQNIGWANKYPCPPSPPATHQPWFCIKVITRFEKKSILNREKSGRGKGLQGKKDSKLNDAMRSIFQGFRLGLYCKIRHSKWSTQRLCFNDINTIFFLMKLNQNVKTDCPALIYTFCT